MQRRHHLRALADGAADTLDRTRAHVAYREHAGHRGLKRRNRPAESEIRLRAGHDKAAAIERDAATVEPGGCGICADEQEDITDVEGLLLAGEAASPAHALERGVVRALESPDLGVEHQFDVRRRLDALDQIARHAGPEPAAADHHV